MSKIKRCSECHININLHDDVIQVDDNIYHAECVEAYPNGHAIFTKNNEFIGESEDGSDGMPAVIILDTDEYINPNDKS